MHFAITRRRDRGFSLVELMIAMLIGLLGMIVIFQVFENAEGVRRTTVSGGDAQQNGALALYSMEHDLRNAGMGINEIGLLAPPCNIVGYDAARATPNFPPVGNNIVLTPVQIVPGADARTPDQLNVFYGSQTLVNTTTLIAPVAMTATPNYLQVNSTFGFRPGDLLLLFQPGAAPQNCIFLEVTSISSNQVNHISGAYPLANNNAVSVNSRFNPPSWTGLNAGLALTFSGNKVVNNSVTRVFDLGNLHDSEDFPGTQNPRTPVYNGYAVANNSLTVSNQFVVSGGAPTVNPIADNIVHMRAEYGLDDGVGGTAGDGVLDRFLDPVAFNALPAPLPWQYIMAVRIVVVARSALPEKAGPGTACDGTTPFPTWSGNTAGARGLDLSAVPTPAGVAWDCYRYRVFETVVPVRNSIWKSS